MKHYFVILCLLLLLFVVVVVVVVVANVVGKGRLLCVLKAEGQKVRLLLLFFFAFKTLNTTHSFFFFLQKCLDRHFDLLMSQKKRQKKTKKKTHAKHTTPKKASLDKKAFIRSFCVLRVRFMVFGAKGRRKKALWG